MSMEKKNEVAECADMDLCCPFYNVNSLEVKFNSQARPVVM